MRLSPKRMCSGLAMANVDGARPVAYVTCALPGCSDHWRSGRAGRAATAGRSVAVFAPALPGRSSPASASLVLSNQTKIGWKPNPPLKFGAASSFSEWHSTSVGSTPAAPATSDSNLGPACNTTPPLSVATAILERVVVACTYGAPFLLGGSGPSASPESQAGQALRCVQNTCRATMIRSLLQGPGQSPPNPEGDPAGSADNEIAIGTVSADASSLNVQLINDDYKIKLVLIGGEAAPS
jgi:hypothetical protein